MLRSEQRELTVPLPEALIAGFVHTKLPTLLLMLELPGFVTPCKEEMGVSQMESLSLFSSCIYTRDKRLTSRECKIPRRDQMP